MGALDGLHVEVDGAVGGGADGGVTGVGEGAGLPVAETGDIVFVAAEVLLFCGSADGQRGFSCARRRLSYLSL